MRVLEVHPWIKRPALEIATMQNTKSQPMQTWLWMTFARTSLALVSQAERPFNMPNYSLKFVTSVSYPPYTTCVIHEVRLALLVAVSLDQGLFLFSLVLPWIVSNSHRTPLRPTALIPYSWWTFKSTTFGAQILMFVGQQPCTARALATHRFTHCQKIRSVVRLASSSSPIKFHQRWCDSQWGLRLH